MVSVSFSVALLALPLAITGIASAANRRCTTEHYNVGLAADSLQYFTTNSSAECASACLTNARCAGYNYVVDGCFLWTTRRLPLVEVYGKVDNITLVSARCTNVADKRLLLTPPRNADFPGLDIRRFFAVDPTECSYTCQDTDDCFAYSWTNYQNGSCYLKSGKPTTVTGPYDGSVVSGQVFTCQPPRYDADTTGTDMTSVPRGEWQDCCDVCRSTSGCKGFSWSNYNGGTCWLKSAVTGFTTNSGVISAIV